MAHGNRGHKMTTTGTALNTVTKALLEVCSQRGISADNLLAKSKISPILFEKFNDRIPADKKRVIWEEAPPWLRRQSYKQFGKSSLII